ncbi:hypothetical protein N9D31_03885 [Oligoflexaceae bacterium]|nr:hypothetical protein [Oligoflexaceae bacterium]
MFKLTTLLSLILVSCSGPVGGGGVGAGGSPPNSNDSFEGNNSSNNFSNESDNQNQGGGSSKDYIPRDSSNSSDQSAKNTDFVIAEGTGSNPWNERQDLLQLYVGDTLTIRNEDSVPHRLHTGGIPCEHGSDMQPGESYVCELSSAYDAAADGVLYDHHHGETAEFWIRVTERSDETDDQGDSITFAEVAPVIEESCGGGGCHSSGSPWPEYVGNEANFNGQRESIISRIESNENPMPPLTSGRSLSNDDYDKILGFFQSLD